MQKHITFNPFSSVLIKCFKLVLYPDICSVVYFSIMFTSSSQSSMCACACKYERCIHLLWALQAFRELLKFQTEMLQPF